MNRVSYFSKRFFSISSRLSRIVSSDHVIKPPTFITTPIFYVNSAPHIGHLYTTVYADAIYRFSRLVDPESSHIFSTGTDEHGLKIQRSAQASGKDLLTYCDEVSQKFLNLFDAANISYTDFIRTTEERHKKAVSTLWNVLVKKGFIYKSTYEGYYSVNDEAFVPENLIITNSVGEKISAESGHKLEWHEEENYMFRLSELQDKLVNWIDHRLVMKPANFHTVLKAEIQRIGELKDISISRSKTRLAWGVDVPGDCSQVIYVWFDALINYLTVVGFPDHIRQWPACHLIGKDILKFHAIYWPSFLMAADLEPPNLIYCHSHWLYEDHKMSKSKGNVVDPFECISNFTSDGIRFFLLKEGTPHSDSNFNTEKIKICLNADLANTLGNLLNRCTSKKLNKAQQFPYFTTNDLKIILPESLEIIENARKLASKCYTAYLDGNFYIGIMEVMNYLKSVNQLISDTEPWTLAKSPEKRDRLDSILYVSLESVRISAILLNAIIPQISESILNKLNCDNELRTWKSALAAFNFSLSNRPINQQNYIVFSKMN